MKKETYEDRLKKLEDKDSPYFCASSTLLALYPLILTLKKEILSFDEVYDGLDDLVLKLYEEDSCYFAESKKEELTDSEWNSVIETTEDYTMLLSQLHSLVGMLSEMGKTLLAEILEKDRLFLCEIVRSVLEILFEREDKPSQFDWINFQALDAMRG